MMISESIGAWARGHSMEDTLATMMSGEVIHFAQEEVCLRDSMAQTALTAAYMYFEISPGRHTVGSLMTKVSPGNFTGGKSASQVCKLMMLLIVMRFPKRISDSLCQPPEIFRSCFASISMSA